MPEDGLPPLGERPERPRDHRTFQLVDRGVGVGLLDVVRLDVVGVVDAAVRALPVVDRPPHGREQVGPEPGVGPAAALEHGEDLGERVLDGVLGGLAAGQMAREPARGGQVPLVERSVGGVVALADPGDERGVAGPGVAGLRHIVPWLHACSL